uniref:hypothetical protein n=1 Tax=Gonatophragmium mori TaxID=2966219 RepID=UPI0023D8A13E|nr:hypothetical protein P2Z26_mgp38 [Gonatophragmium mori]WCZ71142.1 hypothetical protein [Gonatophragmium mori]
MATHESSPSNRPGLLHEASSASSRDNFVLHNDLASVTNEDINKLVINQEVFITKDELDNIKNLPIVKFDLPLNDNDYKLYNNLIGTSKTKSGKAGVYIFTHKPTGSNFVGSTKSLSRRLDQYFNLLHFNNDKELLIPLIKQEGLEAFNLHVIVMPEKFSSNYYFLFLEQYYLLSAKFNLNIQRVVNFRVTQGNTIYFYNSDGTILYHVSRSLYEIKDNFGIHPNTIKKGIKSKRVILGFFLVTNEPISIANNINMSVLELSQFIKEKRNLFKKNQRISKGLVVTNVTTKEKLEFSNIITAVSYFKDNNVILDRNKISKFMNSSVVYKGYTFRWNKG